MVIKTQKESVEFLTNAGFKVSTSQFNRDVLAGKVAKGNLFTYMTPKSI